MSRFELQPTPIAGNKANNFLIYKRLEPKRVLELGPYDGTDTVYLSQLCNELITIEGREINYIETLKKAPSNVKVIFANLETFDLNSLGRFDCVWASGIIYHLPEPVKLLTQISDITDNCLGWTHLTPVETVNSFRDGYLGKEWPEGEGDLAGLSEQSWWFTPFEFQRAWFDLGFTCNYTSEITQHPNGGLAAQFWANKDY